MDLPEWATAIVSDAVSQFPEIDTAAQQAEKDIRAHPEFTVLVDELVRRAVRGLVNDKRHCKTRRTKWEARGHGQPTKTDRTNSETLKAARNTLYDTFYIGSTCLGDVLVKNLLDLANEQQELSDGHRANAEFLGWLHTKGKKHPDKKVRDAVKLSKAVEFWQLLQKKHNPAA